ncbi:MAG: RDD family protein [Phycisphaerae bacterium]|nr:RDD family protein [Phycisphaerae bacterium]
MQAIQKPVFFLDTDYASVPRRVGAFLIDLFVVFLLLMIVLSLVQIMIVPRAVLEMPAATHEEQAAKQARITSYMKQFRLQTTIAAAVPFLAYHILLRRSDGGTVGYRLLGLRLVNEFGVTPDLRPIGRRFLLAVPACSLFGAAYLTCLTDQRRQAFHDRWAGTWVIRKDASPAGPAELEYYQKMLGPLALQYRSVSPAGPTAEVDADRGASDAGAPPDNPL